jgi:hypothetical protein
MTFINAPGAGLTSAVTEWQREVLSVVRRLADLMRDTQNAQLLWDSNPIWDLVLATAPGEKVATGEAPRDEDFTREELLMYLALFGATKALELTPIPAYIGEDGEPVTMTPRQITGYRRMPAPVQELLGSANSDGSAPNRARALPKGLSNLPRSAINQEKNSDG